MSQERSPSAKRGRACADDALDLDGEREDEGEGDTQQEDTCATKTTALRQLAHFESAQDDERGSERGAPAAYRRTGSHMSLSCFMNLRATHPSVSRRA